MYDDEVIIPYLCREIVGTLILKAKIYLINNCELFYMHFRFVALPFKQILNLKNLDFYLENLICQINISSNSLIRK